MFSPFVVVKVDPNHNKLNMGKEKEQERRTERRTPRQSEGRRDGGTEERRDVGT